MNRLLFGRGPLEVSRLGMGCMSFAGVYGPVNELEAIAAVHRALELGVNLFDTADAYGNGASEQLLARALAGRRAQALVATKFGNIDHLGDQLTPTASANRWQTNGRPEYVRSACEASLRRLNTDVIDLYYLHRVDPDTPIEDTVGAMADLVRAGKVREIGLSEAAPHTIQRAHAVHPLAAVQMEYSLWTREAEKQVIPLCAELGITFVAYSPLGRGFLTGEIGDSSRLSAQDWRRHQPRFSSENWQKNADMLDELRQISSSHGCPPAAVALAWTIARHAHVLPITGAKQVAHVEANVEAMSLRLSQAEVEQLDLAFSADRVAGERYPEMQMKRLGL